MHCPRLRFPIDKQHLGNLDLDWGALRFFILLKGAVTQKKKLRNTALNVELNSIT